MKNPVYRDGRIHVLARQCATCIFRPGNLCDLRPGRREQMVRLALRRDSCIPCHETLGPHAAICRGFWDRHRCDVVPLRLAQALDNVSFVKKE